MKTVAITGVGGFLGFHLCNKLLEMGVKVYGIDVKLDFQKQFTERTNYVPVVADFAHYKELHTLINDQIDVFFHFAWQGGLLQNSLWDYELQLLNAKYACDAFVEASLMGAKRFVNSGTNNQIEITQFLNSKDITPRGTTIYASAKIALELMCKTLATKRDTEFVGCMIPMPYGDGNRSMQLFNVVAKNLIEGTSPKLIEGNNLYDMIYIGDIVDALIAIAEKGKAGRTYYIGHRKLKTFRQWIEEIRDIVAPDVELKFGEYKDPLNMEYSCVDLEQLYNDTGFECTSDFKETIKETFAWIKDNL
jgi:Nucleoside-diphosphate-sugar epimerases